MASTLFTDAQVSLHVFEELRTVVARVAERLNRKRGRLSKRRFAQVHVTEVLVHPSSGASSFTVSYSDLDKNAPRFVRKAVLQMCSKDPALIRLSYKAGIIQLVLVPD